MTIDRYKGTLTSANIFICSRWFYVGAGRGGPRAAKALATRSSKTIEGLLRRICWRAVEILSARVAAGPWEAIQVDGRAVER